MSLSRREQVLGAVTVLAILFGVLGFTARTRLDRIRDKSERMAALARTNASERVQIEMGPAWRERYEAVRDQMPVFEPGRQVDTYWLSRMDALANQFGVTIIRRQVGKEVLVGDVSEFSIECREWEGTLDAFIHFLHAMQAEGAMLDVRDLLIRPHPSAAGVLRGSFTLFCAFMRGTPVEGASPAGSPTAATPAAPATMPTEPAIAPASPATTPTEPATTPAAPATTPTEPAATPVAPTVEPSASSVPPEEPAGAPPPTASGDPP